MNTFTTSLVCLTYAGQCSGERGEGHSLKAGLIEIIEDFGSEGGGGGVIAVLFAPRGEQSFKAWDQWCPCEPLSIW